MNIFAFIYLSIICLVFCIGIADVALLPLGYMVKVGLEAEVEAVCRYSRAKNNADTSGTTEVRPTS